MNDIAKQSVEKAVSKALGAEFLNWTVDVNGNSFGWVKLCAPESLLSVAPLLAECGARLMTVTATATTSSAAWRWMGTRSPTTSTWRAWW